MTLHFVNARLIDPEAQTDAPGTLTVAKGRIAARDSEPPEGAEVIDCAGKCLAPGIVDWGVQVGEPGARHKESFRSAGQAAAAGGVTTLIARPDTDPAIDTPEVLDFVRRRAAAETPVNIRHMAALTRGRAGREMAEIGFLLDAGALAFTDADRVVQNTRVMARCLTYARGLGALVVGHPQDPGLSAGAAATSGKFASLRGLPAVSPMAERMGFDRDMALVEMTGARYHADQITCARTLPALERAKGNGFDVTAGISIHHLTLNEFDVGPYRTFFKLTPPLRSEDDRNAVVQAVADGLIDVIASFHTPAGRGNQTPALRGSGRRRGRPADPSAGSDAPLPRRRPEPAATVARDGPEPGAAAGPDCGRLAARRPGRSGAVRSRCPLRSGPLHAAVEIQEHPL
jgi:dihydroorotase